MRTPRRFFPASLALILCLLGALSAYSQYNKAPTVKDTNPAVTTGDRAGPSDQNHLQMLEKFFTARQKEMLENSDRILRLATDLNTEINHPAPQSHIEPSDSVHKVETIARLAHNIRQKMVSNDIR